MKSLANSFCNFGFYLEVLWLGSYRVPKSNYSQQKYEDDFLSDQKTRESALNRALDTRKFEIELYWKRATYFWAFIGATFAGFLAVQAANSLSKKEDLSIILSCIGLVFSVAWLCVNRGSKYWQENWEKHVDMLEDGISGPLYKVVLTRGDPKGWRDIGKHLLTGPSPLSVSKINQLISLYVCAIWIILVWYSLPPFSYQAKINWFYLIVISLSLFSCLTFFWLGGTYQGGFWHRATIRTTKIRND